MPPRRPATTTGTYSLPSPPLTSDKPGYLLRVKILYVCADLGVPVLGLKGASVHVRAMADAFVRAGHETILAAAVLNKSPWETSATTAASLLPVLPGLATRDAVIAFKRLPEMLELKDSLPGEIRRVLYHDELLLALRRRFVSHPPDMIYERASLYGTVGAQLAEELDVPLVLEVNSPIAVEQATYRGTGMLELAERAERFALGHAAVVAVVSEELRGHVEAMGAAPSRVHVVPNAVDIHRFRPNRIGAAEPPAAKATPVIGFVGGLRQWHGVELLPEVLSHVLSRLSAVRLVVAGDGPLRSTVAAEAERLGVADRVELLGPVAHDQMPDVIRSFDIALAPYPVNDRHPFYFSPLKLFEYMACGVPVVASNVGQVAELLTGESAGVLCPPGDPVAMANACIALLEDPRAYAAMASSGPEIVAARYTWDGNAQRVLELVTGS